MRFKHNIKLNHRLLRVSSVAAVLAISVFGSIAALAWGPERQTYTIDKPADKITFNAITNNPNHGDERNFTLAKKTSEGTDQWRDVINVTENSEYTIRIYVHNNAAANLNLVAENTRVKASIPNILANEVKIQGQISASNASPQGVWDQVVFKSDSRKFNIAYIAGTAMYYNNINPSQGFKISDDVITNNGALIGYEKMDGRIPGCFQYSGILSFKVRTQVQAQANFNVTKQVRKAGDTEWQKSIKANPGDKIEYRLGYDNVGEATQNNVIARDYLPKGVKYVNGSTFLKNGSNPNGDGMNMQSNDLTTKGVNIGNYAPNANAFVKFTAQISEAKDLECGVNKLVNRVNIATEHGAKENTAEVEVNVDCKPTECKPGIPEGSKECEDWCEVPGKEHLKPNDPDCNEDEPALPTELPKTGPTEAAMMLVAVIALTGGVAYWYRSREELKQIAVGAGKESEVEKTDKVVKTNNKE